MTGDKPSSGQGTSGRCDGCNALTFLLPLHGARGGPLRCPLCIGAWHAEHGKRRRHGRIVIRAIRAYLDNDGRIGDIDKLKQSAICSDFFGQELFGAVADPVGYLDGVANTNGETIELTSELLADAIRLAHPDYHPAERRDLARRTTQGLLALVPFTFPAERKPEPSRLPRDKATKAPAVASKQSSPPAYPCADCRDTTPYFYCDPCKAEYEKRQRDEDERRRAKQREWYAKRKLRRRPSPPATRDKDKPRNSRQSTVAVNQTPPGNLINHSLSGLQAAILVTVLTKRVPGARGADVSQAELLVAIWGWKTEYKLRWTEDDVAGRHDMYRAGDTRPVSGIHGAFNHIPRRQYRAARVSLSRAITRLHQRMLVEFVVGTMGTYGGGLVLTPHGERIARQLLVDFGGG